MKNITSLLHASYILLFGLMFCVNVNAQTDPLIEKVAQKLALVNDYVAEGTMKTDVSFIKASLGKVKIYFKKPSVGFSMPSFIAEGDWRVEL